MCVRSQPGEQALAAADAQVGLLGLEGRLWLGDIIALADLEEKNLEGP